MDQRITVDIDLLERVFAILIAHLREVDGGEVRLDHDYFWCVPPDQVNDVYKQPQELTIGQVSESLEWLAVLSEDPNRPLKHHLVWLADVLRAIGYAGEVRTE